MCPCGSGTGRVYVDEARREKTGPATDIEDATMEVRGDPVLGKHLSCQIGVTEELGGLGVRVSSSQYRVLVNHARDCHFATTLAHRLGIDREPGASH